MDTEQAKRVQAGDVALYRRARHRIVAVYHEGFWAPYFELEGADVVGHALVDSVEIQPEAGSPRAGGSRRPGRARIGYRIGYAGKLLVPELGVQA
jgi:hypothetical protein